MKKKIEKLLGIVVLGVKNVIIRIIKEVRSQCDRKQFKIKFSKITQEKYESA